MLPKWHHSPIAPLPSLSFPLLCLSSISTKTRKSTQQHWAGQQGIKPKTSLYISQSIRAWLWTCGVGTAVQTNQTGKFRVARLYPPPPLPWINRVYMGCLCVDKLGLAFPASFLVDVSHFDSHWRVGPVVGRRLSSVPLAPIKNKHRSASQASGDSLSIGADAMFPA